MKYPSKEELRKMNSLDREKIIKEIERKTGYTRSFLGLDFKEIDNLIDVFEGIFGEKK
jgi:hypothetical protein